MADEITLPPSGSFDSNLSSDTIDREEALLEEQNFQQQEETKNAIQNKAVGVDVDAINAATPATCGEAIEVPCSKL